MKNLVSLFCITLAAAHIHAQPLNPAPAIPNRIGRFADERVLASGTLKLDDADVKQVLEFYQELVGKTVLIAPNIPPVKITIKAQSDLTVREAIQALESILSMNGVSMIEQGEKFMKAVPEQIVMGVAAPFSYGRRIQFAQCWSFSGADYQTRQRPGSRSGAGIADSGQGSGRNHRD